ncbi:MAG: 8-oxo-dGTP diphosphatase [Flavobacteriales bacterium]|jgi:8-oxo-dGTP diphosphatase
MTQDRTSHIEPLNPADNVIAAMSIDNLIFSLQDKRLNILLVKHGEGIRKGEWALPGGWIRYDEDLRDAATRHLYELTGVKDLYLEQLKTFGRVDRFPNERVVTVAYFALIRMDLYPIEAGASTQGASWYDISELPNLIYDHQEIVDFALSFLRHKVRHEPIGFNLLPEKFTLLQLQALYEAILDVRLDKPNFRRKLTKMNLLLKHDEKQVGVAHRAANLYSFDEKVYKDLMQKGFTFEL